MSNGAKVRFVNDHQQFLEEMLAETQQSLAFARSVREARFIHGKIVYLRQQLTKLNGIKSKRKK